MAETEKIELTHPSGRFNVSVSPSRAAILQTRGYRPTGSVEKPKAAARTKLIKKS